MSAACSRLRMEACFAIAAVALVAMAFAPVSPAHAESVVPVGALREGRLGHTATLLSDGRVLLVGGDHAASAELYDPATRTFRSTTPPNVAPRYSHAATLLPNGHVLVVGGTDGHGTLMQAVERYDPVNDRWHVEAPLAFGRISPRATQLADGRVLVTGGFPLEAEIYDPASGTWSAAGAMAAHRTQGSATRLSDGRVLVAAGKETGAFNYNTTAEIYDPRTNGWTPTGSMLPSARVDEAVPLGDGRILMAGGYVPGGGPAIANSEAYDPRSGTWSSIAPLPAPRVAYAGSPLRNGDALVAGGIAVSYADSAASELFVYAFAAKRWRTAGTLMGSRGGATATLLESGEVLIAGGGDQNAGLLLTAELYVPDPPFAIADVPGIPMLSLTSIVSLGMLLGVFALFALRTRFR